MGIIAKNPALGRLLAAHSSTLAAKRAPGRIRPGRAVDADAWSCWPILPRKRDSHLVGQPAAVKVNANIGTSVLSSTTSRWSCKRSGWP
jgi:hypothetical protein